MIEHLGQFEVVLTCDNCGEELEFDFFHDAVEFVRDKSNQWRNFKNEIGEWEDRCPDCNPYKGRQR